MEQEKDKKLVLTFSKKNFKAWCNSLILAPTILIHLATLGFRFDKWYDALDKVHQGYVLRGNLAVAIMIILDYVSLVTFFVKCYKEEDRKEYLALLAFSIGLSVLRMGMQIIYVF